jgi:hypothetical protein
MPSTRLPDCRPPRRDDSITSESSRPEVLIGEFALRPRIRIRLSAPDREALSSWRRRVLAFYTVLAAAITGYVILTPGTRTIAGVMSKDERGRAETCVQQTGDLPDTADRQMPRQVAVQDTNGGTARLPLTAAHVGRACGQK